MITRAITGRQELLNAMSDLIPPTSPLAAELTRGETITANSDGTPRKKRNSTFVLLSQRPLRSA